MNWLKKGDANTKFFHAVANGRKNRNFIPRIIHEGSNISDPLDIGGIFTGAFRNQFGCQRDCRFKINWQHLFSLKSPVDLSNLEVPFSVDEIKEAMFALGADKSPGPDGFPILFSNAFGTLFKWN